MMSTKKYRIRLTTDEQQELNALVSRGRAAAYKQTHARILLMSDESRSDGGMKDADSSGPHHQDSGEAKIRESTAGVSRKPSSDGKACGCSSKHLCGLTAWNT